MSHLKIILASVLVSVVINTLITLALVSPLNESYFPQQFTESPMSAPDVTAEVQPEVSTDPLEVEFQSLIKRNQEIAEEMSQYEFTDPKHAALLKELDEVNEQIGKNIIERKSN